jgi:AcrR family transcriptional regulator
MPAKSQHKKTGNHRGRPRAFDESQALYAAIGVFAAKGYEEASLADLTKAMGINRFSMYATFGNKEALFVKALEQYDQMSSAHLANCLGSGTAREAIEKILHSGVEMVTNPENPGVCFVTQGPPDASEKTKQLVARKRAAVAKALQHRFDRAIQEGELPSNISTENLARFYSVMIQGLALQAQHGGTKQELLGVVEVAMENWPEP